eukprot:5894341-Prymnesium_polylepis.1
MIWHVNASRVVRRRVLIHLAVRNKRSIQLAVRRCTLPTPCGGLVAKRAIAREDNCSSVSSSPPCNLPTDDKPSIWFRSSRGKPSSCRSLSSLIDVMGITHAGGSSPKKAATGRDRRLR